MAVTLLLAAGALLAGPQQEAGSLQSLLDKGSQAARENNFAAAEKIFRSGLEAAQSAGDKTWAARFLQSIGEAELNQGRPKEAVAEFTRALELFKESGRKTDASSPPLASSTTAADPIATKVRRSSATAPVRVASSVP